MLLHNPGTPLTVSHWFMLELRSERTSEETIKRLGKAIRATFLNEEVEVFIPVVERDLDTFILMTECYIFIRADDVSKIAKLRRVTGVQGVLAADDSTRSAKFLKVDDEYVQGLIRTCHEHHLRRAQGIKPGSWVRLLDGQCKGYCGTVLTIDEGRVLVQVEKKTKIIHQETSIHNLLDMSHVPVAHRVFYYCSTVQHFLEEHPVDAEAALATDLRFDEQELRAFLMCDDETQAPKETTDGSSIRRHTSREQTPTRFAKSLLNGGETSMAEILRQTAAAIQQRAVVAPKTATILWHVLREAVVSHHFPDNTAKPRRTYSDVEEIYGKLTPVMVQALLPTLPLRTTRSTAPEPQEMVITTKTTVSEIIRAELAAGRTNLLAVVQPVLNAITLGLIRPPKHVESFSRTVRFQVLRHFRSTNPTASIVQLVEQFGETIRLSPTDLNEQFPAMAALLLRHHCAAPIPTNLRTIQTEDVAGIIREKRKTPPSALQGRKATITI